MFFSLDLAASIKHAVMQIDNVSWTIILGEKKRIIYYAVINFSFLCKV